MYLFPFPVEFYNFILKTKQLLFEVSCLGWIAEGAKKLIVVIKRELTWTRTEWKSVDSHVLGVYSLA